MRSFDLPVWLESLSGFAVGWLFATFWQKALNAWAHSGGRGHDRNAVSIGLRRPSRLL